MPTLRSNPVVHLELHTGDLPHASSLYAELCGWRPERIETPEGSYVFLELGDGFGGGIVECGSERPVWLPYVEVPEVAEATDRAAQAGGVGPARAPRGSGRVAERRHQPVRRRDRLLAAKGQACVDAGAAVNERSLLEAARAGDESAFARLVEPHRGALHAHCYRMLGSVHDAEDALQEALLSAWRGLPRFEERSSLRSWLYAITTNACLRAIERRPKRVLPIDYSPAADPHDGLGEPLVESVWVEPYPDASVGVEGGLATPEARYEQRESIELAFVAALQHLPARQRAVLILRDVLGFSAREVARALETTPAGVDSALQRAHKAVDERLPERSQQAVLRSLDDQELRGIVDRFVEAWERADVDAVVAMLTADGAMTMPPVPTWYRGRDAAAVFLERVPLRPGMRWRVVPVRANAQPAFGKYLWDEGRETFAAHSISVLTLDREEIAEMTTFLDADLLRRFGLPDEIEPDQTSPHTGVNEHRSER